MSENNVQYNVLAINHLAYYPERCFKLLGIDWDILRTIRYLNSRSKLGNWEFHPVDIQKQCEYGDYVWRRVATKLKKLGVIAHEKIATGTKLIYRGLEKIAELLKGSIESVTTKPTRWFPTSVYNVYNSRVIEGSREEDIPFDLLEPTKTRADAAPKPTPTPQEPPSELEAGERFVEELAVIAEEGIIHSATIPAIVESVERELNLKRPGIYPGQIRKGALTMIRDKSYKIMYAEDEVRLDQVYYEVHRLVQRGNIAASDALRTCVCILLTVWYGSHSLSAAHALRAARRQVIGKSYFCPQFHYSRYGEGLETRLRKFLNQECVSLTREELPDFVPEPSPPRIPAIIPKPIRQDWETNYPRANPLVVASHLEKIKKALGMPTVKKNE